MRILATASVLFLTAKATLRDLPKDTEIFRPWEESVPVKPEGRVFPPREQYAPEGRIFPPREQYAPEGRLFPPRESAGYSTVPWVHTMGPDGKMHYGPMRGPWDNNGFHPEARPVAAKPLIYESQAPVTLPGTVVATPYNVEHHSPEAIRKTQTYRIYPWGAEEGEDIDIFYTREFHASPEAQSISTKDIQRPVTLPATYRIPKQIASRLRGVYKPSEVYGPVESVVQTPQVESAWETNDIGWLRVFCQSDGRYRWYPPTSMWVTGC